MNPLNLPSVQFRIRKVGEKHQVFDVIRKKFVALTPEEWVRQHFLHYLINQKGYPTGLLAVEMPVTINGLKQRADLVVYNRKGKPVVIVECKAPAVVINRLVFDQAARYNMQLKVHYLIVTNGLHHYCAQINPAVGSYTLIKNIPDFIGIDVNA